MKKYSLLGVNVIAANYQQIVREIIQAAKTKQCLTVAPVASHPLVLAQQNQKLKQLLNSFDYVLPDSQYVKWALNFLFRSKLKDKVYGPKLFLKICEQAEKKKLKVFLYGNKLPPLIIALQEKFPKLKTAGIDLKHKKLEKEDFETLVYELAKTKADILFIGLGSPLQHWLAQKLTNNRLPIVMVGAAFDFVSGIKSQAPEWIQNSGLEWLFRLWYEPRRLWKRYLWYGPVFIFLVLKEKIGLALK